MMSRLHSDFWLRELRAKEHERARQAEREMFEDAERHAAKLPPVDRIPAGPVVETVRKYAPYRSQDIERRAGPRPGSRAKALRRRIAGRGSDPIDNNPRVEDPTRHPNSAICQIVQLWKDGKI